MKYEIIKNKKDYDIEGIMLLLKQSYWANSRTKETVQKSIENSICYYVIEKESDKIVGFARAITDYATTYYLCDVIVDEAHRGKGIGKKIVETVIADDELQNTKGILRTEDAHSLYERYGFEIKSDKFLEKIVK